MQVLSINEVSKIEGNRYSLPRLNLQLGEKDFVVVKTANISKPLTLEVILIMLGNLAVCVAIFIQVYKKNRLDD